MTDRRNVDQLAGAIRKLIEVLIARDQGQIGVHQSATVAQADLRDALIAAFDERRGKSNPTTTTETRP